VTAHLKRLSKYRDLELIACHQSWLKDWYCVLQIQFKDTYLERPGIEWQPHTLYLIMYLIMHLIMQHLAGNEQEKIEKASFLSHTPQFALYHDMARSRIPSQYYWTPLLSL